MMEINITKCGGEGRKVLLNVMVILLELDLKSARAPNLTTNLGYNHFCVCSTLISHFSRSVSHWLKWPVGKGGRKKARGGIE